jgi:hypothetical protein
VAKAREALRPVLRIFKTWNAEVRMPRKVVQDVIDAEAALEVALAEAKKNLG